MGDVLPLFSGTKPRKQKPPCSHPVVSIDVGNRVLTCAACGVKVDPFEYVRVHMSRFDALFADLDRCHSHSKKLAHENNKLRKRLYPGK